MTGEAIDCDDARDMIADGNAVVRRAVRARRCVCAGRGLCVHTWPVVHDVGANEVVNLTEFFFSKNEH